VVEELRNKLQELGRARTGVQSDEEMVDYLVKLIKDKEQAFGEQNARLQQMIAREASMKDQVQRYQFLYEAPPKQEQFSNPKAYPQSVSVEERLQQKLKGKFIFD
jgi:hypothetical protein